MIDLRSDTLTIPDKAMLETTLQAKLGDSGRFVKGGRGDDGSVNDLEDLAASIMHKEAAAFLPSGTMGNTTALLTHCRPGDKVLVDHNLHAYHTEKVTFDKRFGQLEPVFYGTDENGHPVIKDIERMLKKGDIKLLCLEDTHNANGGVCLPLALFKQIRVLADQYKVPIHLDGARIFNAAIATKVKAEDIAQYADTLMFCVSKGLGAPIGSMVCGTKNFIDQLRATQKLLGGCMRQAGVVAIQAIYALNHNVQRMEEDHKHARYVGEQLKGLKHVRVQGKVETNMVMLETLDLTPETYCALLAEKGLITSSAGENRVRLVFYKGITDKDVEDYQSS